MLSKSETIPPYNQYDPDIWELKQDSSRWSNSQGRIKKALTQKSELPFRTNKIGKGIIFSHAENFVYAVAKAANAGRIEKWDKKPTVWKIMCPRLENPKVGSIYYIVETKQRSLVCRATYGYLGAGPCDAAFIEACLEKLKLHFEVRDGDYLLHHFNF